MQITAAELAKRIGATIEGNPDVIISSPAKIEEAGPGDITFLANPAYESHLYSSKCSAVLVGRDFTPREKLNCTLLRVDNVYETVSQLLEMYQPDEASSTRRAVSDNASVDETATLGDSVRIGKFSIISEGAKVGQGSVILDQVFIGPNVTIGKNCLIYPGVRIMRSCVVGNNCIVHANTVIGADGFGFTPDETNTYRKVPQIGNVLIEDHVEIGAGTTIDRATMGSTIIRQGVKLDNQIQIAHNVEIGENTVIASQTGIAGSTKVGKNCRIGGQVGITGHIKIAEGTAIQAQSGISSSIKKPYTNLWGSPAIGYRDFIRSYAVFKQLPEINRLIPKIIDFLDKNATPTPKK